MNTLADQFNAELRVAAPVDHGPGRARRSSSLRARRRRLARALAVLDGRFSSACCSRSSLTRSSSASAIVALIDKLCDLGCCACMRDRVADIVLTEPEPDAQEVEIDPRRIAPVIEVRGLSFRYGSGEPWVIEGSRSRHPGRPVASRSRAHQAAARRRSSRLLLGLLTPTEGEIRIGGIRARSPGARATTATCSAPVMQDDQLFAGTIRRKHRVLRSGARLRAQSTMRPRSGHS
jgi:ATP-binding cassette subfamily B protein RaxB